mgnify:CR=1 FL=1
MRQGIALCKNVSGENLLTFTRSIGDRNGMIRLCCAEGDLKDIDYNKMEAMMDEQMSENFNKEWEEKWKQPKPNPILRRSTTAAPSKMTKDAKANDAKYLVKRLAHYSSMADALVGGGGGSKKSSEKEAKESVDLNVSDKENSTPNRNYR